MKRNLVAMDDQAREDLIVVLMKHAARKDLAFEKLNQQVNHYRDELRKVEGLKDLVQELKAKIDSNNGPEITETPVLHSARTADECENR